jgi:hypothetical protein
MKTVIEMLNNALPLPNGFHIRIENEPYLPLVIEGIGRGPRSLPAISVAHYYTQNGDAMRDPEMCFEVGTDNSGRVVELMPYYWRNDGVHIEQESVMSDGRDAEGKPAFHCHQALLRQHIAFALLWDRNITAQGYADALLRLRLDDAATPPVSPTA